MHTKCTGEKGGYVVHRDLKLENILVDEDFNLKLADFGFAKKVEAAGNLLKSHKGTMTYMAPEIKLGELYDGKQVDVFALGVILFIIVVGLFPFQEATLTDYFFKMVHKGEYEKYWKKVAG